jgi:hypothetical protein
MLDLIVKNVTTPGLRGMEGAPGELSAALNALDHDVLNREFMCIANFIHRTLKLPFPARTIMPDGFKPPGQLRFHP